MIGNDKKSVHVFIERAGQEISLETILGQQQGTTVARITENRRSGSCYLSISVVLGPPAGLFVRSFIYFVIFLYFWVSGLP